MGKLSFFRFAYRRIAFEENSPMEKVKCFTLSVRSDASGENLEGERNVKIFENSSVYDGMG